MRLIRAYGQGISRDLRYTGKYEDEPYFGDVDYETALNLIRALPLFSVEAFEEDLCPPDIILQDDAGNNLVISSSPGKPGMYNVFMGGAEGTGTVTTNAPLEKVANLVWRFFSRAPIEVEVTTPEKVAESISREKRTLAYASCKAPSADPDSWSKVDASVALEEYSDGRKTLTIWVSGYASLEIPISNIIEIELKQGGFLRNPRIKITYIDEGGKKRKTSLDLESKYKKNPMEFRKLVSSFSAALPGRVKVK